MVIIKPVIQSTTQWWSNFFGLFSFNESPWLAVCFSNGLFGFFHGLDSHGPRSEGCHQINTLDMDGYSPLHLALLSPPTQDQTPGRMGTAGRQKGKERERERERDIYIYTHVFLSLPLSLSLYIYIYPEMGRGSDVKSHFDTCLCFFVDLMHPRVMLGPFGTTLGEVCCFCEPQAVEKMYISICM